VKRISNDRGQAAVITVMFLATLLGAVAMVLDVGSWFREQRDTQSDADAAALASAQALPTDLGQANALAVQYLNENDAGAGREISFSTANVTNDTVTVRVNRDAPGIFSKLFGINSVNVHATAKARAGGLQSAKWVAPIAVNVLHPDLNCGKANGKPVPCFGKPTQLDLDNLHQPGSGTAAGAFSLINLEANNTGNIGASTIGDWIVTGYDQYMELGNYNVAPSTLWNDFHVRDAMANRLSDDPVLLFPIYDRIIGSGSGAEYHVVGWVAFHVSSYEANGSTGKVKGAFEKVIWEGIQSQSGSNLNYGTTTIELVE
jgi:putative Flp pilus-assembly TadE/G-like protein